MAFRYNPTYDCPCNNRGWIKEADSEEITEANRLTANNGIAIYMGTMVYEGSEFDPLALTEPVMIEYNMRGMIVVVQEEYAGIMTGGGRTLLVIMRDDSIYKFTMEMRHEPEPFWVVTSYMDFYENGNVALKKQYVMKSVEDLPDEPRVWAEKLLQEEGWVKDHLSFASKTYILIKSSSGALDSVELVQDYFLIEAGYGVVNDVSYVETYRSMK